MSSRPSWTPLPVRAAGLGSTGVSRRPASRLPGLPSPRGLRFTGLTDLDVVDRLVGEVPHLQVLRAARGAQPAGPTSVLLPTAYGQVKVDVLGVRQIEIDQPGDDPSDRLLAFAHAWASDTATEVTIEVAPLSGAHVQISTLVAEPGPLVAMRLQAIMSRAATKQGTDLQAIARLILDELARPAALPRLGSCPSA